MSGITTVDRKCNWTASANVTNYFETHCVGKRQCSLNFTKDMVPPGCLKPNYNLFIAINCIGTDISVFKNEWTISRETLTIIVIGFDLAICLVFTIWTGLLD